MILLRKKMTWFSFSFCLMASICLGGTFSETTSFRFEPEVTVTIDFDESAFGEDDPLTIMLYALPNGNTTAQTFGRVPGPVDTWRYDIQHIGAQSDYLRQLDPGTNLAVVYLEVDGKSWPGWKKKNAKHSELVLQLLEKVKEQFNTDDLEWVFASHSGGGSFIWQYLDGVEEIRANVQQFLFLDSNYSYSNADGHGNKLIAWLKASPEHHLTVLAYDERTTLFNGKPFISPTGGTYRASHRMLGRMMGDFDFEKSEEDLFVQWKNSTDQVEFVIFKNPEKKILHTTMVGEYNGLIYGMTTGTGLEQSQEILNGPRVYSGLIEGAGRLEFLPWSIPPRHPDLLGGTEFIAQLLPEDREERENLILAELEAGNLPEFLRHLVPVVYTAGDANGTTHTVTLQVMADYLSIGDDEDFVRMPMNPYIAQSFCDKFGYFLPTVKIVDEIWKAADQKLEPTPLTQHRDSPQAFLLNNRLIEAQLIGISERGLVAGTKKDVVITNKLQEKKNKVAIYGWHYSDGKPIQPLYTGHVDWYVDYSHGIRPVRREVMIDKMAMDYQDVLMDENLAPLLSDEGVIVIGRYE